MRRLVTLLPFAVTAALLGSLITPTASPASAALPTSASAIAAARSAVDWWYANGGGATSDASWRWTPYFLGVDELYRATGDTKYRGWLQSWGDRNGWNPTAPASPTSNPDSRAAIQVWEDSAEVGVSANLAPSDAAMASDLSLPAKQYWWIDAMFMGLPLWTTWTDRTGDAAYRAKGAQFYDFLKTKGLGDYRTGCPNTGLFDQSQDLWWRDCSYVPQRDALGNKVFWARGNGWVLGALARTLMELPPTDPQYAEYASMLQRMSARLAALQPSDGLWRSNLLSPSIYPAPEASGSALFVYAMAYGIRAGLLDRAKFSPVVQKAWDGLMAASLKPSGFLSNCQGVGEAPGAPSTTTSIAYCVGAFALAATELAKLDSSGATPVASDSFTRTLSNGWGAATIGGAWSGLTVPSSYSVGSGAGRISTPAGGLRGAYLVTPSTSSSDATVTVSFSRPTSGSVYAALVGRRVGSADYSARAVVASDGTTRLQVLRSGTTLVQQAVPGLTFATGDRLRLRVAVTGTSPTTIVGKAWRVGSAEPSGWLVTSTDSTAGLQAPGGIGVTSYLSGGAAPTSVVVSFDDLDVLSAGITPAPNLAPTASFSSAASGLSITADGRGSTDTDGAIAAFAWSFGDGSTASGSTVTHAYATAGTYQVRLTVTDDDGATATITRAVDVTAPAMTPLASDDFSRTASGGWGSATVGGAWSGLSASYSVAGGAGRMTVGPGQLSSLSLTGVSSSATDVVVTVAAPRPSVGSAYLGVVGRGIGTDGYSARAILATDGSVRVQLLRSSTTLLTQTVAGLSVANGDAIRVRIQVTGTSPTTIRARVWKVGAMEPTSWQATATDSTPVLQAPGGVGVSSYFSGGGLPAPMNATFDDLLATRIG